MPFVAVLDFVPGGPVLKFADGFQFRRDAQAHVDANLTEHPDAFVSPQPPSPWSHWKVNPPGNSLITDPSQENQGRTRTETLATQALRVVLDDPALDTQTRADALAILGPTP